jgi:hypothetical protein
VPPGPIDSNVAAGLFRWSEPCGELANSSLFLGQNVRALRSPILKYTAHTHTFWTISQGVAYVRQRVYDYTWSYLCVVFLDRQVCPSCIGEVFISHMIQLHLPQLEAEFMTELSFFLQRFFAVALWSTERDCGKISLRINCVKHEGGSNSSIETETLNGRAMLDVHRPWHTHAHSNTYSTILAEYA